MSFLIKANGQEINQKPYDIKSGIIEYGFYGDNVGKGTLWFDDYGMKSAMYSELVIKGETVKQWVVLHGDYQFTWNPAKPANGIRIKNPVLVWAKEKPDKNVTSYNESVWLKKGMRKYGTETCLKRPCIAYKGNVGKLVVWHGILMLLDLKTYDEITHQAATSVKTNVVINPKYFVIPRNVKFTEKPAQ